MMMSDYYAKDAAIPVETRCMVNPAKEPGEFGPVCVTDYGAWAAAWPHCSTPNEAEYTHYRYLPESELSDHAKRRAPGTHFRTKTSRLRPLTAAEAEALALIEAKQPEPVAEGGKREWYQHNGVLVLRSGNETSHACGPMHGWSPRARFYPESYQDIDEPAAIAFMTEHSIPWPDAMGPKCWIAEDDYYWRRHDSDDTLITVGSSGDGRIHDKHADAVMAGLDYVLCTESTARAHCHMDPIDSQIDAIEEEVAEIAGGVDEMKAVDSWPIGARVQHPEDGQCGTITSERTVAHMAYIVEMDNLPGRFPFFQNELQRIDDKEKEMRYWIDDDKTRYWHEVGGGRVQCIWPETGRIEDCWNVDEMEILVRARDDNQRQCTKAVALAWVGETDETDEPGAFVPITIHPPKPQERDRTMDTERTPIEKAAQVIGTFIVYFFTPIWMPAMAIRSIGKEAKGPIGKVAKGALRLALRPIRFAAKWTAVGYFVLTGGLNAWQHDCDPVATIIGIYDTTATLAQTAFDAGWTALIG